MVKKYLTYLFNRVNAHGIHSPFVFEFYNEVILKAKRTPQPKVETLRATLIRSKEVITVKDLGAGSRKTSKPQRSVSEIAKYAGMSKKQGQLITRIIDFYGFKKGLEIGTSLGIGAAYMASSTQYSGISIEGCEATARIAQKNLAQAGFSNIEVKVGEFSEVLANLPTEKFDFIYIDGNHRKFPTLDYFEYALNHSTENAFIVFDDIHWSDEMEEAWEIIQLDERINLSLDLFRLGIISKRNGQRKQHFIVKF
jgi:predicted O-methyltransferase YrrM